VWVNKLHHGNGSDKNSIKKNKNFRVTFQVDGLYHQLEVEGKGEWHINCVLIVTGAFSAVKHKEKTAIRCEALSGKIAFY
jgi:hypothetical protein